MPRKIYIYIVSTSAILLFFLSIPTFYFILFIFSSSLLLNAFLDVHITNQQQEIIHIVANFIQKKINTAVN